MSLPLPRPDSSAFPFDIRTLHRALLRWYRAHKRPMPWRDVENPYYVLVSEFMLQQTQALRVIEKFDTWIVRFPALDDLARASRRDVLIAWSGLGYNRRALHLHNAAIELAHVHAGVFPKNVSALEALPGIGAYTARAIACFGLGVRVPVVDVNVRRLYSRLLSDTITLGDRETWEVAELLLPIRSYYDWNQGIMEFGALVCTALSPRCGACPLSRMCASAFRVERVPQMRPRVLREPPRRYHRGRLIEFLRNAPRHRATFERIGTHLREGFTSTDAAWLSDIVGSLEKDGLVIVTNGRNGAIIIGLVE